MARLDGGQITSDAGALLLCPVEQRTGILRQLAACWRAYRKSKLVEHTVGKLVRPQARALALGSEDLNDHDQLRRDPLLAMLSGESDPEGERRKTAFRAEGEQSSERSDAGTWMVEQV